MQRPLGEIIDAYNPDTRLAQASTIPASWYVDPRVMELERRTVFASSWQVAGRADQVRDAGDYLSCELPGGEPVVVVRGADGLLRGFFNVCRHHAAAVVTEPQGSAQMLRCPYHGWTYALDGALKGTPDFAGVCDFDRAANGLVPIDVDVWEQWVFVRVNEAGSALAAFLGAGLTGRLQPLRLGDLHWMERRRSRLDCNWKVFVDNYLDGGYHVPHLHRALAADLEFGAYRTEVFDRVVVQSCGGRGERLEGAALYAWVHPNLMVNRYGPALDVNVVLPTGPESCEVVLDWYFAPDAEGAFVERAIAESEQVQREDVAISERVQAGLRSRAYDTGRYAPALEAGAHRFHRILAGELA